MKKKIFFKFLTAVFFLTAISGFKNVTNAQVVQNVATCTGDIVRLEASDEADALTNYAWAFDDGVSVVILPETGPYIEQALDHGVYTVTYDVLGVSQTDTFKIFVYPYPDIQVMADQYSFYVGDSAEMTVQVNNMAAMVNGFARVIWYDVTTSPSKEITRADISGSATTTSIFTPSNLAVGTYKYEAHVFTGLAGAGWTSGMCRSISTEIEITVNPLLIPPPVLNIDTLVICAGTQVRVSTDSVDGGVFTWYRNGVLLWGITGHEFIDMLKDSGIYEYKVVVDILGAGCQSPMSDAGVVIVHAAPVIRLFGDHDVCDYGNSNSDNINITASLNGYYIPYNSEYEGKITWYQNGVIVETPPGYVLMKKYLALLPNNEPYVFEMEYIDTSGCVVLSDPFVVTVHKAPVVNITASQDSVCINGTVELTANLDNYNETNYTYQWYLNGRNEINKIPGATKEVYTTEPRDTVTTEKYYVRVFQLGSQCETWDTIIVKTKDIPVVEIVIDKDRICQGGAITISAISNVDGFGTPVYTWYRNGVEIQGVIGASFIEYPISISGDSTLYIYTVRMETEYSGCVSEIVVADSFYVYPAPIVLLAGSPIVCAETEDNIKLVANVSSNLPVSYQWFEDNVAVTGITTDSSFVATKPYRYFPYNYTVKVFNTLGCFTESEIFPVYVNEKPVIEITAMEDSICQGGTTTLFANLADQNSPDLIYQWYMGDTTGGLSSLIKIQGATHLSLNVTPYAPTLYTFIVTQTSSGCVGTASYTIGTYDIPVIDSIAVNDKYICSGGQLFLSAINNVPLNGNPIYTWYRNGVEIRGATQNFLWDSPLAVDNDVTKYVYSVSVTTDIPGCITVITYSDTITVYQNPRVGISGEHNFCENMPITLAAFVDHESDSVGNLTYTWYESIGHERDNQTNGIATSSQFYVEYWPPRTDPYLFTVEVTRLNGCRSYSEEFEVYVHELPVVNVTASDTIVCEGGEVTLTANLNNYNAGMLTYQWFYWTYEEREVRIDQFTTITVIDTIVNDIPGATKPIYKTNVDDTTVYGVRLNQLTSRCEVIATIRINTVELPAIATVTVKEKEICQGNQASLSIDSLYIGGVLVAAEEINNATYTWYREDGSKINLPSIRTLTETLSNAGTYNYYVSIKTDMIGCESEIMYVGTVIVNVEPVVVIAGAPTVCDNKDASKNIYLTANVTPSNRVYKYEWFLDNVLVSTADTADYAVYKAGRSYAYKYTVKVTDTLSGCFAYAAFDVTVNAAPIVDVIADVDTVCAGGKVELTARLANNTIISTQNLTYKWTVKGNSTVLGTLATMNVYPTQPTTYVVEVTETTSGCITIAEKTIIPRPIPVATLTTPVPQRVCSGGDVTVTASITSGGIAGGEIYTWYINNNIVNGVTTNILKDNPIVIGMADSSQHIYTVKVTQTASGCISALSTGVTAIAYQKPTVTIAAQGNTTICASTNLTLQANVITKLTSPAVTYQWYRDGAKIQNATSATYVVNENTAKTSYIYHVEVNQLPGCSPISNTIAVTVVPALATTIHVDKPRLCQGGTVTLTAQPSIPDGTYSYYTYDWMIDNVLQPEHSASIQRSGLAAGTRNISLTVKPITYGNNLCNATANTTVTIDVMPTPTLTTDIDPSRTMCVGGDVTLMAAIAFSSPIADSNNYEFEWRKDGQPMISNYKNVRDILSTEGKYGYQVRVKQNDNYGCTSVWSNPITVTVIAQPVLTIAPDDELLDICEGGNVKLTATITNPNALYNTPAYAWYDNTRLTIETTNIYNHSVNSVGKHNYYAVLTPQGRGCKAATSNVITYNVAAQPIWDVISVTPREICEGETVTLEASVKGGVTDAYGNTTGTVQWQAGTTPLETIGGKAYDIPSAGTVKYTATYTNHLGNGCKLADATPITVKVNARPTAEFISGDSTIVCGNDINSYADLVVRFEGTPPFRFTLVGSDGTVQNMVSQSKIYTIPVKPDQTTYYYIASLSDNSGCVADANSLPVAVYVSHITGVSTLVSVCGELDDQGNNPLARVYFDIASVYPGQQPTAAIRFLDPAYSQYNTIGNIINVAGDYNYVEFETPTTPGDYAMEIEIDGCSYPFTLRIMASNDGLGGTADLIHQRWDDVVVVNNNPKTNGGYTFTSYQWYKNGVEIPGATDQFFQDLPEISGNYSVRLIGEDENGNRVEFTTCDMYFAVKRIMKAYPIPAGTFQSITIEAGLSPEELDGAVLDIYTAAGQHLKRINVISNTTKIEGFAVPGYYVGKITTGTHEVKSIKIVVVN